MSAPTRFRINLRGKQTKRGTRADRALLRAYFLLCGFTAREADAAVSRWSAATNRREFERKVADVAKYFETVDLTIVK